jgi:hypothetical protein
MVVVVILWDHRDNWTVRVYVFVVEEWERENHENQQGEEKKRGELRRKYRPINKNNRNWFFHPRSSFSIGVGHVSRISRFDRSPYTYTP